MGGGGVYAGMTSDMVRFGGWWSVSSLAGGDAGRLDPRVMTSGEAEKVNVRGIKREEGLPKRERGNGKIQAVLSLWQEGHLAANQTTDHRLQPNRNVYGMHDMAPTESMYATSIDLP